MPSANNVIKFPTGKAPQKPSSQSARDRDRFRALGNIGTTFGPCTMPSWAGQSGWSDEDIAWLDEIEKEEAEIEAQHSDLPKP